MCGCKANGLLRASQNKSSKSQLQTEITKTFEGKCDYTLESLIEIRRIIQQVTVTPQNRLDKNIAISIVNTKIRAYSVNCVHFTEEMETVLTKLEIDYEVFKTVGESA